VKDITPHVVLKNTTSNSIAVEPKFTPLTGGSPYVLPQVSLAAKETREVDLNPLLRIAQRRHDLDVVSIEITNWAAPGSLVGSLYGINNATGVNYDIPLRDSGPVRTMTGSYPWQIADDFTTIVYITNISDQQAEFVGEVNYQGGHVLIEPRKLAPRETAVFDLEKFRDEQASDTTGNKLPKEVSLGQFKWAVHGVTNGKLLLIGRAEMVSRSQHVSTSYSCNDPCPPYYQGDLNPFPPPIVLVSETGNSSAWETAYYGNGYSYTWAASAAWTADSSAVSLDPSAAHTTTITGDDIGDGCITADMGQEESYGWDGLNCYDNNNTYPVGDSGCIAVKPRLDLLDPPRGAAGTTLEGVRLQGKFGSSSNQTVHVSGSGITATVTRTDSVVILATFEINAQATPGNHSVTVEVNGHNSNSLNFFVQIPTSLSLSIGALRTHNGGSITGCDGSVIVSIAYGYSRLLTYTVLDQTGTAITQTGLTATEQVYLVSSYPVGSGGDFTSNVAVGADGTFCDVQALYHGTPPAPQSGEYIKLKQYINITTSGRLDAVRVNCLNDQYNDVSITDTTSNPNASCQ